MKKILFTILLAIGFLGVANVSMAASVSFDTSTTHYFASTSSGTSTINIANNPNRILVIGVTFFQSYLTSILVNGVSPTLATSSSNGEAQTLIYYFVNPPVGTTSVFLRMNDATGQQTLTLASFYNVNQSTPIGAKNRTASSYNLSITPNSSGSMIFGEGGFLTSPSSTGSNQKMIGGLYYDTCSYTPTTTTAGNAISFSYSGGTSYTPQSEMVELLSAPLNIRHIKGIGISR